MRLAATMRVDFNSRQAKAMGESFTAECAAAFGDRVMELAKRNVAPGKGPGPHPHKQPGRVDTGNLQDSIQADIHKTASAAVVTVFTPLDYGTYLEAGWHAPSGRFYRYPWLWPAINQAQKEFLDIVRSHSGVAFTGGYTGGRVAVKKGANAWDSYQRGWRGKVK